MIAEPRIHIWNFTSKSSIISVFDGKIETIKRNCFMDKMRMESADITDQNIKKIGALFPNCITEAKSENGKLTKAINFELLKQELSKEVIGGDEASNSHGSAKRLLLWKQINLSVKHSALARQKASTGIPPKISILKAIILKC